MGGKSQLNRVKLIETGAIEAPVAFILTLELLQCLLEVLDVLNLLQSTALSRVGLGQVLKLDLID